METLLKLNTSELNESLLQFLQTSFHGKNIVLHVYEDTGSIDTGNDWADKIKDESDWYKQENMFEPGNNAGFSIEALQNGLVN